MLDALSIFDGTLNPAGGAGVPGVLGSPLTTTRASTNVLDLLSQSDGAGGVAAPEIHVAITSAFAGGTSLQIELQTSPDNVNFVGILDSPVYPVANLITGSPVFRYRFPLFQLLDTGSPNRYVRLFYTVVGTMTAGSIISYLSAAGDRQNFYAYPIGYSIDA